jgi:hypothetical protein
VTVAAVILAASPGSALREVDGVPNIRRLADTAWAGGALPVVVVAPDPDGAVAAALTGSEATLAEPAALEDGPAGQIVRGIEVATELIVGTDAVLIWPARMGWVDAETVTSLIEAHGVQRATVLRPSYRGRAGWPALVPVIHLDTLRASAASLMPDAILERLAGRLPSAVVDLGDPGVTHDLDVSRAALPPFEGPSEPASGHVHEWGAAVAERPDDVPVEGRSRAASPTRRTPGTEPYPEGSA